ncbi:hypothetical protein B1B04_20125 [Lysinibacillus sp. KCTC 33748]|uniref:hypothetical protein n=1 Tax=unclassified Lysinibacillus TaxID=2636778 RepID=UPI0009A6224C|nr:MULTISPECIES: hypothetical protein [unclassified Lysinibacillus]OXS68604.1 hypothetical protein B1B04_20125 [Lysinibacillus sp. KCTC 33748]
MFLSVRKRSDSKHVFVCAKAKRQQHVFVCAKAKRQQHVFVCAKAKRQQQHEGRQVVGHFGNATGRGVFIDEGQLTVIARMRWF